MIKAYAFQNVTTILQITIFQDFALIQLDEITDAVEILVMWLFSDAIFAWWYVL